MLKALLAVGFMVTLPVIGLAQANDPHVGIQEDGVGPLPLSQDLNDVQPDNPACTYGDGTCNFIFINDTNSIVDAFTFQSTFLETANFQPPTSAEDPRDYTCSSAYFESCTATLTLNDGVYDLDYSFLGIEPPNGDGYSDQNPTGEPEGIPPGDVFFINLAGWDNGFQNVTLTNTFSVPEASSALILLTELFLLAGVLAIFRRRLNWKLRLSLKA